MKPIKKLVLLSLIASLCACHTVASTSKDKPMQKNNSILDNLTFECKHEVRPPIDKEVHSLYDYALYHDLHNMWRGKKGDEVWQNMAAYYRIAAYNGDYQANLRLQWLLETKRVVVKKPQTEVYHLNKELEKTLPATAMYKLYYHLDSNYGVKTTPGGKFVYLRKAADMGSREAQLNLGQTLALIKDDATLKFRLDLREQLLKCATTQGQGEAAKWLGIYYESDKKYQEAIQAYHQGVKSGNQQSAFKLYQGFDKSKKHRLNAGIIQDLERSKRYEMIGDYLFDYDFLKPTVPDLDEIVPLPPAKLPPWDGKIAFQRWFEGPSPQKPSDELMQKLAEKAGLDWQTGLPLKK
ncbi:DUF6396 domain-containing protein [Avibacterium sp. 20-15]|uniref:SEL1-like repeat protein n=1 Tax=unclassified Avibacterium TaxID=2685287 RepID=UPI002026AE92|nr:MULTISPECIES: DUF6396 domain-containing protein [unclassified Avibacterium]MCW9734040.1 DUF6396 domain-containing protein [Avibacterium sp. 20-15]URL03687.1 DUF6396 domain-containing protein [Avibacterium sp. 20-132]